MSTTLIIRNLDEAVKEKLRLQAAVHQRSMEAKAREILTQAVAEEAPVVQENASTPEERMRRAIESIRGIWKGRKTTDELMELTRGDRSDDAYARLATKT